MITRAPRNDLTTPTSKSQGRSPLDSPNPGPIRLVSIVCLSRFHSRHEVGNLRSLSIRISTPRTDLQHFCLQRVVCNTAHDMGLKMEIEDENLSLRELYNRAEASRRRAEGASSTSAAQRDIEQSIAAYERCVRVANEISLFSSNESLDDVSSRNLE